MHHHACAWLQALQAAPSYQLERETGGLVDVSLGDAKTGTLEAWADWNCISENCESWGVLGPWIEENKPKFGPNIIERFLWSKDVTPDKVRAPAACSRDGAKLSRTLHVMAVHITPRFDACGTLARHTDACMASQ